MKISTNSRYALRFLMRIAMSKGRVTTLSVANAEGISEKMLERIAAKLKKSGYVKSVKGIGGGYELAMPAEQITAAMVLKTMETPYLPIHCIDGWEEDCRMSGNCVTLSLWKRIDEAIAAVTDSVTIADLAGELSARLPEIKG